MLFKTQIQHFMGAFEFNAVANGNSSPLSASIKFPQYQNIFHLNMGQFRTIFNNVFG